MRYGFILTIVVTLVASAAYAQEPRGYIEGSGGLSRMTGATSGAVNGEVGVKLSSNLVVFGNIGDLRDLHWSSLQTSVDGTVSSLAANNGLTATSTTKVPTWYTMGGARLQFPNHSTVTPYVFGGIGFAQLRPSVRFAYQDGALLSGDTGTVGQDITSDVVSNGLFTLPTSSTHVMLRTGGGVQVPIAKHLMGSVGYSVSRIAADTPIHTQDVTFGLGVRF
jgi:opacity protein-like surface antigen